MAGGWYLNDVVAHILEKTKFSHLFEQRRSTLFVFCLKRSSVVRQKISTSITAIVDILWKQKFQTILSLCVSTNVWAGSSGRYGKNIEWPLSVLVGWLIAAPKGRTGYFFHSSRIMMKREASSWQIDLFLLYRKKSACVWRAMKIKIRRNRSNESCSIWTLKDLPVFIRSRDTVPLP